jgi:hypothetical protein
MSDDADIYIYILSMYQELVIILRQIEKDVVIRCQMLYQIHRLL